MTAQILHFPRPTQEIARRAELPVPFIARLPEPANTLTIDAIPVGTHAAGGTIVDASMALSAACREMAASLAILVAHCESADSLMADVADGADMIAEGGVAIGQAATCLTKDVTRAATAVTTAARACAMKS